ncbi:hypothetical protein EI427_00390 [Flammeovirga pectinis]|uniref:Uncharacterized protein n=1 Tax=Flammeovirga pectinis TaxID=2494373 RepID=A0A3Q9FI62_9BACT|nr:hypothetical protein [Flammeovirga pectinis]AZQ60718.1 hypothetical protein EI427_00390 [Flammeovirga pectinis]
MNLIQKLVFGVLCFFFTSVLINFFDETTQVNANDSTIIRSPSNNISVGTIVFKWNILKSDNYLNPVEVVFNGEKYFYRGAGTEKIENLLNGTYKVKITLLTYNLFSFH